MPSRGFTSYSVDEHFALLSRCEMLPAQRMLSDLQFSTLSPLLHGCTFLSYVPWFFHPWPFSYLSSAVRWCWLITQGWPRGSYSHKQRPNLQPRCTSKREDRLPSAAAAGTATQVQIQPSLFRLCMQFESFLTSLRFHFLFCKTRIVILT